MRWVLAKDHSTCQEESIAGGKGASLARLAAFGANVPPFVVVTAQAHRDFGDDDLPAEFLAELREAISRLDDKDGLAVRSSAIGEDAADSSFAGLYNTFLEVRGFDAIVAALKACWASYRNVAAMKYRAERGTERSDGAMAVVIQQMIDAEWAGVSFTANPVTLALSTAVINVVPGLGEVLVSGAVNPEEITVNANDGRILDRKSGASPSPFPDAMSREVWKTSRDIAERLGFPQDVEWALKGGALFILQSRPITTIADVFYSRNLEPWKNDPLADPDNPERIWSRMMADETWVSPISPLFYDIHNLTGARAIYIKAHDSDAELPPDIFKYHRATAYADIDVIRRMYEYQPSIARIKGVLNFLPSDLHESFRTAPWRWSGRLRRIWRYETQNRTIRSFFKNYRVVQTQWASFIKKSDAWFDADLDARSDDQLREHQTELAHEMGIVGPPCGIAVLSHASDLHLLLTGLLDRWCKHLHSDGENLYARISAGLEDSETVREGDALWDIAQLLRSLGGEAVSHALSSDWKQFVAEAQTLPNGPVFIDRFLRFWRASRHLGSTYKDIVWPRWGDDIDICFDVLKSYVQSGGVRPSKINARSAAGRLAAQAEILRSFRGPLAPVRRRFLKFLFRYNELYMSVRDNHRYYVDRNWYENRRIYLSYGARLVKRGVLKNRDDVFFLGSSEIAEAMAGRLRAPEALQRISLRRQVWERTLREQGPKFLKGWAPYSERLTAKTQDSTMLQGIAASPGTAVGVARIIYDVRDLPSVKDGEILVTRQTDPSWTTVFGRIGGLILETGGVLSHGTSLCREYGLPCVTAVELATVRIADRARIEVAGSEGLVRILDRP